MWNEIDTLVSAVPANPNAALADRTLLSHFAYCKDSFATIPFCLKFFVEKAILEYTMHELKGPSHVIE